MKKFFTFIAALAAALSAGAQQLPLTGSATIPMPSTQPLTVSCPAIWDGVNLAGDLKVKPAEYPKAVIEIDAIDGEGAENFSLLCKVSGATYAFESNVAGKPKQVVAGKIEYDLTMAYENWVWGKDLSDATFDELTIKSRQPNQTVTIKSFYLIDKDDNLVPTTYKLLATASAPIYSGEVTFTSKWNELGGAGWKSGEVGAGDFVIYSVLLNTPFEGSGLQFKFNDGADHYDGGVFVEGTTALYLRKDVTINFCSVQRNGDAAVKLNVRAAEVNINKVAFEIPASGLATFAYDKAVDLGSLPEGVTAYSAKAPADGKVQLTPITGVVQANYPFIVKGPAGICRISLSAEEGSWPSTALKANAANKPKDMAIDATVYVLSGGEFHSLASHAAKIPPYKAYLKVDAPAGARLNIVFNGDETTGIETVKSAKADNQYYNMSGQRVAQPTKGLYIVNGKKVIKK